jgi:hypothetical protein
MAGSAGRLHKNGTSEGKGRGSNPLARSNISKSAFPAPCWRGSSRALLRFPPRMM